MKHAIAALLVTVAACSSLVDDPCAIGYEWRRNECVTVNGGGPTDVDAGVGVTTDAPMPPGDAGPTPDGTPPLVCTAPAVECDHTCVEVATDPSHCGTCGHVCPSGICVGGACVGELPGHVVVIGHDYRAHNAAMRRVLGNAVALGSKHDIGIARLSGTAAAATKIAVTNTIAAELGQLGRPFHDVVLPAPGGAPNGIDVLVVDVQIGDGDAAQALGAQWASTCDQMLAQSGVVIVLDGGNGVGHRFAAGANLAVLSTPVDVTDTPAFIMDSSDAVVQSVVSPYLAASTSVAFPGQTGVVATTAGAVVLHTTR